jgi:hypothetical protein
LNIYDLLYHEKLVLTRAAAAELGELLSPEAKKTAPKPSAESEAEPADTAAEKKPRRAPRKKKEAA